MELDKIVFVCILIYVLNSGKLPAKALTHFAVEKDGAKRWKKMVPCTK